MSNLRIGQGFDAHKIIKGSKDFILGGIAIDSEYEVVAHSDGDIISHAIIDALLGACKMGDIGKLAPSNEENKGISSIHLLKKVATMLLDAGYQIVNDCNKCFTLFLPFLLNFLPRASLLWS